MRFPRTLARILLLELVIISGAIGAAWGMVLFLQWTLMLPQTRSPVLAVIVLAVLTTRLATSRWFNRLVNRSPAGDDH